jgi:hypothetical protein
MPYLIVLKIHFALFQRQRCQRHAMAVACQQATTRLTYSNQKFAQKDPLQTVTQTPAPNQSLLLFFFIDTTKTFGYNATVHH